jgi:hypothetical protein
MLTYYLVAHLFLAIYNQSASAIHVNTIGSSHSGAAASISDALASRTVVDNSSTGWFSFDVAQPMVPTASVVAQDSHSMLSASNFAEVELHLGGLYGSGVIGLTSSPAALTTGDRASGIASTHCTLKIQSIPESLPTGNQSSTIGSNNVTSLAALPTPTSLSNNTNFNIPRLSTFAPPALQSLSGEPAGKFHASSYRSIVAAAASLCFIVFS